MTVLYPEQVQASSYARRYGSEAPLESIQARLNGTFARLEALLDEVPLPLTGRRPGPGRWSVHEVVDHLVVSHRRAVAELASLVAGASPDGGPIPAGLTSGDPFARPWPLLVADLAAVHRDVLGVLAGATDTTPLTSRAPVVMVVKCAVEGGVEPVHWVESFDWKAYAILVRVHTLEHAAQVERTLVDLGRDRPSPEVVA